MELQYRYRLSVGSLAHARCRGLAHADAFVDADARVDAIVEWGETELKEQEKRIKESGGTLQDFKKAAAQIRTAVAEKLFALEQELKAKYNS